MPRWCEEAKPPSAQRAIWSTNQGCKRPSSPFSGLNRCGRDGPTGGLKIDRPSPGPPLRHHHYFDDLVAGVVFVSEPRTQKALLGAWDSWQGAAASYRLPLPVTACATPSSRRTGCDLNGRPAARSITPENIPSRADSGFSGPVTPPASQASRTT